MKLHKQTTHLIAAQPRGQKYDKALEWGVEVVRDSWLYQVAQTGRIEPLDTHRHISEVVDNSSKAEEGNPDAMDIDQPPPIPDEGVSVGDKPGVVATTTASAAAAASSQSRKEKERARAAEEGEKENVDLKMSRSASRSGTGMEGERAPSVPRSQSQKVTRARDAKTPTDDVLALANVLSPPRNATQRRLNGVQIKHEETQTGAKEEPLSLPRQDSSAKGDALPSVPSSGLKPSVSALQKLGLDSPSRGIGRTASAPDESPSLGRTREREARGDKSVEVSRSASVSAVPNTATGVTGTGSSSSGLAASNKVSEVSDIMRLLDGPDESMSATNHDGLAKDPTAQLAKSSSAVSNAVNKIIRRGRPSTRLRTSTNSGIISTPRHSAQGHAGDISGDTTMDTTMMFTPSPTGSRTSRGTGVGREMSGTPGLGDDVDMELGAGYAGAGARSSRSMGFGGGMGAPGMGFGADPAEESVRVDYVDPAAEKEKKRMFEQFKRNEKERAKKARMGNA